MSEIVDNTEKHGPVYAAIEETWGVRCEEHNPECFVCKAWAEYDQLLALRAEVERLTELCNQAEADELHCATLTARVKELEEALEWYGKRSNWISPFGMSAILKDGGLRALKALKGE